MGKNFGFSHNDAHTRNVLYDGKTQKLVLIDYGRSYFGSLSSYMLIVDKICKFETSKYQFKKSHKLRWLYQNLLPPSPTTSFSMAYGYANDMHVFDIMRIAMNVVHDMHKHRANLNIAYAVDAIHTTIPTSTILYDDIIENRSEYDAIKAGLFIFAIVVEAVMSVDDNGEIVRQVDDTYVVRNEYFSDFVYNEFMLDDSFDESCMLFVMDQMDRIDAVLDIALPKLKKSQAGGQQYKTARRAKSLTVLPVPKSYFKNDTKAFSKRKK